MKALREVGHDGLFNLEITGERHPVLPLRALKSRFACGSRNGCLVLQITIFRSTAEKGNLSVFSDLSRVLKGTRTFRCSSWDRSGANHDFLDLVPGERVTLLEAEGPGKVTHSYWTTINASRFHFRQLVLRAWWDGETTPSVEVPLGDLFCIPHCTPVPVRSLCAVVNPGSSDLLSWGSNLYLPMPFASSARIGLTYEAIPGVPADVMAFWYHIELEGYDQPLAADLGRFHAQWRRENLTKHTGEGEPNVPLWEGVNLDGRENYVALEAEGCGQMVGLHLQVDNVGGGWYGEADAARVRCREKIDQLREAGADDQAMERARKSWGLGSRALLEGHLQDAIAAFESIQ